MTGPTIPSPQTLPRADLRVGVASKLVSKLLISLVPGERFELPTNGLQNRCSTTELTRLILC
jgi:hypothetical protein